jgi:hypothetical protein
MARSQKLSVIRRNFLRGGCRPRLTSRADVDLLTEGSSGSDYMVDVITSLDFEYNFGNPGSSFRAQHSANSKCERTSSGGTNHGEIQEAVC